MRLDLVPLVALLCAATPLHAREITGSLTYAMRIALPPSAQRPLRRSRVPPADFTTR